VFDRSPVSWTLTENRIEGVQLASESFAFLLTGTHRVEQGSERTPSAMAATKRASSPSVRARSRLKACTSLVRSIALQRVQREPYGPFRHGRAKDVSFDRREDRRIGDLST